MHEKRWFVVQKYDICQQEQGNYIRYKDFFVHKHSNPLINVILPFSHLKKNIFECRYFPISALDTPVSQTCKDDFLHVTSRVRQVINCKHNE